MKKTILQLIFSLLIVCTAEAQSSTIEIRPNFQKTNNSFTTEVIPLDISNQELEFITISCFHFDAKDLSIQYRLKSNGVWSSWISFTPQHEFVESNRAAYRAKPINKTFDAIQCRIEEQLDSELTIRFFLAGGGGVFNQPTILKSVNCDLPLSCERECWCPTCPIDNTPQLTDPTHLIVHHSAGNNESENFAMVVESIWDFHVNTNGWDDIGYNWLIDPNGVLYQGRPDNYQGAHFSCINENTVGICVIGDYSLVSPSEEALNTLVNILAYEATDHAINVQAESYHLTGDFELSGVAGHRDSSGSVNACSGTECPGNSFYPLLPEIRQEISELDCYAEVISAIDESIDTGLTIYPNPFSADLYIESQRREAQTFVLINIYGKSMGFINSEEPKNFSHLRTGIYFLIFEGEVVGKLLKQ